MPTIDQKFTEVKVISTKCPILNQNIRNTTYAAPVSEVLVRLLGNEPVDVICPNYRPIPPEHVSRDPSLKGITGGCYIIGYTRCIYEVGWRPLLETFG